MVLIVNVMMDTILSIMRDARDVLIIIIGMGYNVHQQETANLVTSGTMLNNAVFLSILVARLTNIGMEQIADAIKAISI